MSDVEYTGEEVSLGANSIVMVDRGDDLVSVLPANITSRVFRYSDVNSTAYSATNIICAVRSNDEVIIQAHIRSRGKHTRRNHVRVRLQGFDADEILLIDWTTGNMGVSCGQNEVVQYKKVQHGVYASLVMPRLSFSSYTYAGC